MQKKNFKVGDVVVIWNIEEFSWGSTGELNTLYTVKRFNKYDSTIVYLNETETVWGNTEGLEFACIYNSPLYQALL